MGDIGYEDGHRIAQARELTFAAGCPLRDRYGFAASDEDVLAIVRIVFAEPDDAKAGAGIGSANALHEIEIAEGYDTVASEAYEQLIIAALRPLAEDRRDAAARSLS
jgi:hypothetical protein